MARPMKMHVALQGDVANIKVLMRHPMEPGTRKDRKTGKLVPAHFINHVEVTLNGKPVIKAQWGVGVSKNPFLGLKVKGAKAGDKIEVKAEDNLGAEFAGVVVVGA